MHVGFSHDHQSNSPDQNESNIIPDAASSKVTMAAGK